MYLFLNTHFAVPAQYPWSLYQWSRDCTAVFANFA